MNESIDRLAERRRKTEAKCLRVGTVKMMLHTRRLTVAFTLTALTFLMFLGTHLACGQSDISSLIGIPPHARVLPVRFGQANLDTGDLHLEIPLYSVPERGLAPNTNRLVYDSFFWQPIPASAGIQTYAYPAGFGWYLSGGDVNDTAAAAAGELSTATVTQCASLRYGDTGTITTYSYWDTLDAHGTQHKFDLYTVYNNCDLPNGTHDSGTSPQSSGGQTYSSDGTGYRLTVASDGQTSTVIAPDGMIGYAGGPGPSVTLGGSESPNGNVYQFTTNNPWGQYDELGSPLGTSLGFNWSGNCPSLPPVSGTDGYGQPYPSKPPAPVTCVGTLPGWDSTTQKAVTLNYDFAYAYVPICTPLVNYSGGMWQLQSITLPGQLGEYQFGYDNCTSGSGTHLGLLTSITLPTGGKVTYSYGTGPASTIINTTPFVTSVTDLGGTTTISYGASPSYPYPVTITFPQHPSVPGGTTTVQDSRTITNAATGPYGYGPYTISDYSGSTLIQKTVDTRDSWNRVTSVASTWTATEESHTVTIKYADDPSLPGYQTYAGAGINMVGQESEYDSGTLIRTLTTNYMKDTSSIPYVSQYNMINYPLSQTLTDGHGNTVAQTLYTYDEYSASYCKTMLAAVTGASGHDDTRGTGYLARGNVTTVNRLVSGSTYVTTHACYDTLGNVTQAIDGNSNPTKYSYGDSYLDAECIPSGSNTYAFPTSVTDPLGYQTSTAYYTCNRAAGQVQTQNDVNSARTGTQTTYYADGQINCVTYPDTGQTCTTYPSESEVDKTVSISSQSSDLTQSMLDGFGRTVSVIDSGAGTEVDTSYDLLGRVNCTTNPYVSGSGGSSAPQTCYAYDVLSRPTGILYADGTSTLTISYSGNTTTATDPLGNKTQRKTDAEGRLAYVWEPTSSNTAPTIETDYVYDALNDLTSVTQWGGPSQSTGARSRSFVYDGLSRLIQATNPESGTVCYGTWNGSGVCQSSYDGNGNLLSKTDARGVQTSFSYDALNRLVSKSYVSKTDPSKTPITCLQYDTSSVTGSGGTAGNLIGNLTNEWTQAAGTTCTGPTSGLFLSLNSFLDYDPMGRPTSLQEQQCIGTSCTTPKTYTLNIGYDLKGDLARLQNSVGAQNQNLTLLNYYDGAGRPCLTTSSWSGTANLPFSQNLFSVSAYTPSGAPQNWYLGSSSSGASTECGSATSPLSITQGYTNRLQVNSISVTGQMP